MSFRKLLLALILGISALVTRADVGEPAETWKKSFHCGPRFRHPGFADLDEFVQAVQAREAPWRELLEPDKNPELDDLNSKVEAPGAWTKEILYRSRHQSVVFVQLKANRYAPFCSVIFLLTKQGTRWHVADFIRRSEYGRDSDVRPKMLKLRIEGQPHFYFTEVIGGRKWGGFSDEFYMTDGDHLHRTLFLKNDGAYLSPAEPWREFSQYAEVSVAGGRLRIAVHRIWGLESGEDRKQTFSVTFRWDSRRKKFASTRVNTLSLPEPSAWTAKGLPSPPAE